MTAPGLSVLTKRAISLHSFTTPNRALLELTIQITRDGNPRLYTVQAYQDWRDRNQPPHHHDLLDSVPRRRRSYTQHGAGENILFAARISARNIDHDRRNVGLAAWFWPWKLPGHVDTSTIGCLEGDRFWRARERLIHLLSAVLLWTDGLT